VLLIALSLEDGFYLPATQTKKWYGVSQDSAERGLRQLHDTGLLAYSVRYVKNQRSRTGWSEQRHYTLLGAFSIAARQSATAKRPTATKITKKGTKKGAPLKKVNATTATRNGTPPRKGTPLKLASSKRQGRGTT
jgi:hypothetical protein